MSRLLCFLAVLACAGSSFAAEAKRRPNVLFIVADDLGWRDIGYHGSEIKTPNLDKLAKEGVRLERHYVYPSCSPTRACILTGRNASRFGIHGAIGGRSKLALSLDTLTLAGHLKANGYATAISGKWHLGLRPEVGPRKFGFEESYGYLHGQLDQYSHIYKNGDRTWHRNDKFIDEKGHATDLIAAEAVRFISAKRKKPFFLYVAFSVPHYPVQEEKRWIDPYEKTITSPSRRLYAASVTHMDDAIGKIVAALKKTDQLADTMIVFTSDNGGQKSHASKTDYGGKYGPYPVLGDNRPWRGWKVDLYEGGIRVPAFVNWSGRLKPNTVPHTVSALDWFPTISAVATAPPPRTTKLEGRNVWGLFTGAEKKPVTRRLYWNVGNASAILDGDWKLIVPKRKGASAELYNLADDAAEKADLAAKHPDKVKVLRKAIEEEQKLDASRPPAAD
jgi:arylsulfatase A-like enzyme